MNKHGVKFINLRHAALGCRVVKSCSLSKMLKYEGRAAVQPVVSCEKGMNLKFRMDRFRVCISRLCPYSVLTVATGSVFVSVCVCVCFFFSEENYFIFMVAQS